MISSKQIGNAFVHFEFSHEGRERSIIVGTDRFTDYLVDQKCLMIKFTDSVKLDGVLWYESFIEPEPGIPYKISYRAIDLINTVHHEDLMNAILYFEEKQKVEL